MSTGYEIRHALLNEARDTLLQDWHVKCDLEREAAHREDRAPRPIPQPTVADFTKMATEMYEFVKRKD